MTLKIILKPEKKMIPVPSRHLALFYNVWIKYKLKDDLDFQGGFLRELNIEKQLATFAQLRTNKSTTIDISKHEFQVSNQVLNVFSLNYILELENKYKQLEEKYLDVLENLEYFEQ